MPTRLLGGGTGYCISLENGREVFNEALNNSLPDDVERMFPDYSIYPQFDFAISMTSRGCPRGCDFCHVAAKEGRKSVKVANVDQFWCGQEEIKVLDPNLTGCAQSSELMEQYADTGALINFTQGLDIRFLTSKHCDILKKMKLKDVHFAWDNPNDDLEERFRMYAETGKKTKHGRYATVYCLVNFNSTIEQDLYRIYTLRDLGYDPYVMIYDKPHAGREVRRLQRWCNNKVIFGKVRNFSDYTG